MKKTLNEDLVKAIRDRLLEDTTPAQFLMDTLGLRKESVYRRIRGEVPFAFYETAMIARVLGLSLDEIIGNSASEGAMFNYNLHHYKDPVNYFYIILKRYVDIFYYIHSDPSGTANTVTNVIPYTFFFQYKNLIKFRLCRWLHQLQKIKTLGSMDAVDIPDKVSKMTKRMGELLLLIPTTNIILDKNTFRSFVENILFFHQLNLISTDDVKVLKVELFDLLDSMEVTCTKGKFRNGNKLNLYLSNIDIETTYSYMERKSFLVSLFHLYEIDNIYSLHPEISQMQKNWVLSLRRYSTLITQCGEKDRADFFAKQHEIIATL
ncbi:hypothetical protein LJC57_04855 [Parabacteroides sp. OttesenSCG-928-G07]|nr:hypothetical protein [Parabacteroides sp. OttesenSCG-928-G21]MDL2277904.1 hypothetical protein [Parabacteroides sp. OttesenSCG-928-G07]